MNNTTEATARVKIDALLKDAPGNLTDGSSVLFEYALPDGTPADYVLCDRHGRPMAALEAKRASIDPIAAQDQGRQHAEQLAAPFVFLSNEKEVRFLDREADAHARKVAGFQAEDDLERRIAARRISCDLATVAIDRKIVDRGHIFFSALPNSEFSQAQIRVRTGRATIGKLALKRIRSMLVLVPLASLQLRFAKIVEHARATLAIKETGSTTASLLSSALLSHLLAA